MKIVFMGTPDFAVPCLDSLINAGHEICAVFSQPDKPVGRKQILTAPPVKARALELGIDVYQPSSLKNDDTAYNIIKELNPDVCVVVAYGKILPSNILYATKYGCINVHASLLPKYRGASPVQWAIVCGEKKSGVSTMLLNEGMDTGDILLQSETEIGENETAEELFDRLSEMGAKLIVKTLEQLENSMITPIKQNEDNATYAPIIKKEDALIDFSKSAHEICCLIRGLHFWPVAYTMVEGKRLKIFSANEIKAEKGESGEILSQEKSIVVKCGGNSAIEINEIQLEGSKRMMTADFLNGRRLNVSKL